MKVYKTKNEHAYLLMLQNLRKDFEYILCNNDVDGINKDYLNARWTHKSWFCGGFVVVVEWSLNVGLNFFVH